LTLETMTTETMKMEPMKHHHFFALVLMSLCVGAWAQKAPTAAAALAGTPSAKLSEHVKTDITRHRAMALAHDGAARCLEAGRAEADCLKELQAACKGLAIGKTCGMKHEH
jgi:hypothetical protein